LFFLLILFGLVCFALRERKKEEREVLISGGIFQNNTYGIGSFFVSHSFPLPFPLQFSASSLYCDWFNGRIAVRYRLGSQTKKKPKHFTFYGTKRADIFLFFLNRRFNQHYKAKRRRTTGTGRMRHLKSMPRRFKNGFREGTKAVSAKAK